MTWVRQASLSLIQNHLDSTMLDLSACERSRTNVVNSLVLRLSHVSVTSLGRAGMLVCIGTGTTPHFKVRMLDIRQIFFPTIMRKIT
jgi:hypothetical protein